MGARLVAGGSTSETLGELVWTDCEGNLYQLGSVLKVYAREFWELFIIGLVLTLMC